jgi:hypothetical protein
MDKLVCCINFQLDLQNNFTFYESRVKFTSDCVMVNGSCRNHSPCTPMQIFSIELAQLPVDGGLVKLYGYIAVRDNLDRLLNYVVNISRDDPITSEEVKILICNYF